MSEAAVADTRRLNAKPQDLTDAYGPPSNFLEIDIFNPQTVGMGRARYTSYELRMRTNLPIFKLKESCVRRRYSDFEWLKNELERDSKVRPGSDLPIPETRTYGNSCSCSCFDLPRRGAVVVGSWCGVSSLAT
ncbi:sorting nexin-12 isoform X2 [Strigops habroptila]|uniref:sorting nexin-12 isoform X2 n=1 Tax=Strigops habroptila TaxID=2489341 RepID=UPI0011CF35EC|nr:sorting nexin-12 isoform X2 [Strigops habroptila]